MRAKLVAGKGQYRKGMIAEFFLQSTQPGVLIGEASAARDINDKTRLAGKVLKVNFFALRVGHGELVKLSHSCSLVYDAMTIAQSLGAGNLGVLQVHAAVALPT